jgi:hypothetical protein
VGSIPWDRDRDRANMIDESILKTRNGLYSRVTAGYINLLVHCHMHAITWKQSSFIHIKNWDEHRPTKKFLNSKLRRFCHSWLPCPFVSCYPLLIWQFHIENQENHPPTYRNLDLHPKWRSVTSKTSQTCISDNQEGNALVKVKYQHNIEKGGYRHIKQTNNVCMRSTEQGLIKPSMSNTWRSTLCLTSSKCGLTICRIHINPYEMKAYKLWIFTFHTPREK